MIGNDIVDLAKAKTDSDWLRPRWVSKVFTQKEQDFVKRSDDKDQMVWRLWSMKESAYKCSVQRKSFGRFNPLNFECSLINSNEGIIRSDTLKFFSTTHSSNRNIYSTATFTKNQSFFSKIIGSDDTSASQTSNKLKEELLIRISQKMGYDFCKIEIRKSLQKVPQVFFDGRKMDMNISLTHHGRFSAYAISE